MALRFFVPACVEIFEKNSDFFGVSYSPRLLPQTTEVISAVYILHCFFSKKSCPINPRRKLVKRTGMMTDEKLPPTTSASSHFVKYDA
ncbi:hypothetical protein EYC84_007293 [Monilinia fructicola]|uniref:Uncharacterized protein n=1 Tax=Monilinia fructicola TaxID=38448 RepID=A0A5M9K8W5_MONFR|nr:hypothetical protein EYC84_007293 [Monilinia fructicola]